jgi:hypothetical protein
LEIKQRKIGASLEAKYWRESKKGGGENIVEEKIWKMERNDLSQRTKLRFRPPLNSVVSYIQ